jgi:hypothetical protein
MGMYTELVCAFELKKDAPPEVVPLLEAVCGKREEVPTALPAHPFFKAPRWMSVGCCDSYYFPGDTHSAVRHDTIAEATFVTIRANLKNYDNEIKLFLDWVATYIQNDGFLGYYLYEESERPTLIYLGEDGAVRYEEPSRSAPAPAQYAELVARLRNSAIAYDPFVNDSGVIESGQAQEQMYNTLREAADAIEQLTKAVSLEQREKAAQAAFNAITASAIPVYMGPKQRMDLADAVVDAVLEALKGAE